MKTIRDMDIKNKRVIKGRIQYVRMAILLMILEL